jgi:uncharacterized SAM-binding protein YcdF (DUF218 family)
VKDITAKADSPAASPGKVVAAGGSRAIRRWIAGLTLAILFCIGLGTFRASILTGLADLWTVRQPVAKADAVVVLGGGEQYRPFEAARLYREGCIAKILIPNVKSSLTERLGLTLPCSELNRRILLKQGVPESALIFIGDQVSSTYEEAMAVREWIQRSGARAIIISTDLFHTRRVDWLFHKLLAKTGVVINIDALSPEEYAAANWWQHEEGLIAFNNEVVKYLLYRFKY